MLSNFRVLLVNLNILQWNTAMEHQNALFYIHASALLSRHLQSSLHTGAISSQLQTYLKIARSQISKQQKINQGKPGFNNVKSYQQLSHRQRISYFHRFASSPYTNNSPLVAPSLLLSSARQHLLNQYAA
jgi:hypothetical protein